MISDKSPLLFSRIIYLFIFVELCNSQKHLKKGSTMPNSEAIGATSIHELVNF